MDVSGSCDGGPVGATCVDKPPLLMSTPRVQPAALEHGASARVPDRTDGATLLDMDAV